MHIAVKGLALLTIFGLPYFVNAVPKTTYIVKHRELHSLGLSSYPTWTQGDAIGNPLECGASFILITDETEQASTTRYGYPFTASVSIDSTSNCANFDYRNGYYLGNIFLNSVVIVMPVTIAAVLIFVINKRRSKA